MRTDDEIEGIASAAGAGSRLPGFYRLSIAERRRALAALVGLAEDDVQILERGGLSADAADRMVENAIGVYGLPFGVALNFRVNGHDYLVPMAVEEPTRHRRGLERRQAWCARAAASRADADEPLMTAQIEVTASTTRAAARRASRRRRRELLAPGARPRYPGLVERGGGRARSRCATLADGRVIVCTCTSTARTRWAPTWSTPSPRRRRPGRRARGRPTSGCASSPTSATGAACA